MLSHFWTFQVELFVGRLCHQASQVKTNRFDIIHIVDHLQHKLRVAIGRLFGCRLRAQLRKHNILTTLFEYSEQEVR